MGLKSFKSIYGRRGGFITVVDKSHITKQEPEKGAGGIEKSAPAAATITAKS